MVVYDVIQQKRGKFHIQSRTCGQEFLRGKSHLGPEGYRLLRFNRVCTEELGGILFDIGCSESI